MRRIVGLVLGLLMVGNAPVRAQDSTLVRLSLGYRFNGPPGLMVLSGPGLDSVRAIIDRGLVQSDRFEMPLPDSLSHLTGPFDPKPFVGSRMAWVVELQPAGADVEVRLWDLSTGTIKQQGRYPVDRRGVGESRLAIHTISDLIVSWTTAGIGIAATRILYKDGADGGLYRVDADGQNRVRIPTSGIVVGPTWAPNGEYIAYAEYRESVAALVVRTMASGNRVTLTKMSGDFNVSYYFPTFSPNMKDLLFTRSGEGGAGDIYRMDISSLSGSCCVEARTASRKLAENVKPTYSPDGNSVAFETTRSGRHAIYRMDADGTGSEPLVPYDATRGNCYSPAWSPDGLKVAFECDGSGRPQIFTVEVASGRVRQVTNDGRNEWASWAPDSRHLVFRSNRDGRVKLWIWDTESGVSRVIQTPGGDARYPAWSPILGNKVP